RKSSGRSTTPTPWPLAMNRRPRPRGSVLERNRRGGAKSPAGGTARPGAPVRERLRAGRPAGGLRIVRLAGPSGERRLLSRRLTRVRGADILGRSAWSNQRQEDVAMTVRSRYLLAAAVGMCVAHPLLGQEPGRLAVERGPTVAPQVRPSVNQQVA